MDKHSLLGKITQDKDTRQFFAQCLDRQSQCETRNHGTHSDFFTPEEQALFTTVLPQLGNPSVLWMGGFPDSARNLCYFLPEWEETPTTSPLAFLQGRCHQNFSHRDVLGSLMSLGLSRRKMGDIVVVDNLCQVVVLAETASLILSQWDSIGRQSLRLEEIGIEDLLSPEIRVKEIHCTTASLRLDTLVASGFSQSRSKAVSLIEGGKVSQNHRPVTKPHSLVEEGDLLSVRGLGKCKLEEIGGKSRKDRYIIKILKYV